MLKNIFIFKTVFMPGHFSIILKDKPWSVILYRDYNEMKLIHDKF